MPKTFLRKQQVGARYGIDVRSVDRWAADGRLPQPTHRGRIPIWDQDELDERDRQATIERASRKPVTALETRDGA
jgi:predicted DNA-binding transcriptional regulator AlpA